MFEVEQKFRVDGFGEIEAQLVRLGAEVEGPIEQIDTYFAHPARDFAATDEALRIRRVGEENFITYKGPKIDQTTKTRREIEIPFASGDSAAEQLSALLQELSFTRVAAVRKLRRHARLPWGGWEFEIALDDVERVGAFVELEVAAEESQLDDARAQLLVLAAELQLKHVERTSYLGLLLATRV